MRKLLVSKKMCKTAGWGLIAGLLFYCSSIVSVGWSAAGQMLIAVLTCVALNTVVYWLYEHAWAWLFHHPPVSKTVVAAGAVRAPAVIAGRSSVKARSRPLSRAWMGRAFIVK
jgi:hypothetical protein